MSGPILLVLRLALGLILYAFLGWAFLTIWRDLKRQSGLLGSRQPPALILLHHRDEASQSYRFTSPEIVIGRDPICDCTLDDKTVSARHTRLSFHQGQWWVEDLRSTNGTFLNPEPVSAPLVVTGGDVLRCGHVVFTVTIGESKEPA